MPRVAAGKSSASVRPAATPAPITHFPAPTSFTYSGPVMPRPTIGQSIKDGFGLGIGSSIARNMVDSFFHKPSAEQSEVPRVAAAGTAPAAPTANPLVSSGTSVATEYQKKEYIQCMQTINDHEYCKKLINESA